MRRPAHRVFVLSCLALWSLAACFSARQPQPGDPEASGPKPGDAPTGGVAEGDGNGDPGDGDPHSPRCGETDCSALPGVDQAVCHGRCEILVCEAGFMDCNGQADDGCEAHLPTDGQHCGACGQACRIAHAGGPCVGGSCGANTCDDGFGDCDNTLENGCEQPLNTDDHCGACGQVCAPGSGCDDGICRDGQAVAQLTAGIQFACARRVNGEVRCWGDNHAGQIGDGPSVVTTPRALPMAFSLIEPSAHQVCGIARGGPDVAPGEVLCWGGGVPDDVKAPCMQGQVACHSPLPNPKVVALCTGAQGACGISETGAVQCWGGNGGDFLGRGEDFANEQPGAWGSLMPAPVVTADGQPLRADHITCHGATACATSGGTTHCWGAWIGTRLNVATPVTARTGDPVVRVRTLEELLCVLTRSGHVLCAGPAMDDWAAPVPAPDASGFVDLEQPDVLALVGNNHDMCAVHAPEGRPASLSCWTRTSAPTPRRSHWFDDLAPVQDVQVLASETQCFSHGAPGASQIHCVGDNDRGQLGNGGDAESTPDPVRVFGF